MVGKFIAIAVIFFAVGNVSGLILATLTTASGRHRDDDEQSKVISENNEVRR